ncbi:MAG: ABC transporter ATP-binding protein [Alphaproteobacteria bacterium]|nr:ABC transporter ATP-binding protein [Alphaproteobacteria bacterium]
MLKVENLYKQYVTDTGVVEALKGVSFEVESGEIYTLLGPSGCGKSTTLRAVAGLETASAGEITIGDHTVFSSVAGINLAPEHRGVGMVFQSYAIWPHMTVFKNVAFPLVHGVRRVPRAEVKERVMRALAMVQLEEMAERPAPMLSGGQQQRVALARALVYEPKILLLDEPLSNLDAKLRVEMRIEIQRIIKRLGLTGLYVTHDQEEAMAISDRIAVMHDGVILQESVPHEIYANPVNVFVAGFIGKSNFISGSVTKVGDSQFEVTSGRIVLSCIREALPGPLNLGDLVDIVVRPEDVMVGDREAEAAGSNTFEARVETSSFTGGRSTCELSAGDIQIVAELHGQRLLPVGDSVKVGVLIDRIKPFPHQTDTAAQLAALGAV